MSVLPEQCGATLNSRLASNSPLVNVASRSSNDGNDDSNNGDDDSNNDDKESRQYTKRETSTRLRLTSLQETAMTDDACFQA